MKAAKNVRETIDVMMDVCRRFPGAEFWDQYLHPLSWFSQPCQHVEELRNSRFSGPHWKGWD
jgi:hypothetical protein